MNELKDKDMKDHFSRWLDAMLPTLTYTNSIDAHIDELCQRRLEPQQQLDLVVELFRWASSNLGEKLAGKLVMLMVPLRNSDVLDRVPPAWTALLPQLSRTPPSIYVMEVTSFLQPDPAERFTAATRVPALDGPHVASFYQCWRNPSDPESDGWSRDVRVVTTSFLAR
jgi:hypothetical protein